jgi:hypothetical protein
MIGRTIRGILWLVPVLAVSGCLYFHGPAWSVLPWALCIGWDARDWLDKRWMATGFRSICQDMIDTGIVLAADLVKRLEPGCMHLHLASAMLRSNVCTLRKDRGAPAHMHEKEAPCTSDGCAAWRPAGVSHETRLEVN